LVIVLIGGCRAAPRLDPARLQGNWFIAEPTFLASKTPLLQLEPGGAAFYMSFPGQYKVLSDSLMEFTSDDPNKLLKGIVGGDRGPVRFRYDPGSDKLSQLLPPAPGRGEEVAFVLRRRDGR
jgi:hypothetical protein